MRLAALQRAFQAQVLARDSTIRAAIRADAPAAADARLQIYELAYRSRLTDALSTTYPKLKRALGPERFTMLTNRFALEQPSSFPSVRDYGARLGAFLEHALGGIKGRGLHDLAAFEWTLAAAFDGPDATALAIADLAAIAPEHWPALTFTFAPTLHRIATTSNAVQWWRAPDASLPSRWRTQRETQWAISRRELSVYFRSLDADETAVLDLARGGASFGTLCDALRERAAAEDDGAIALQAARYLQRWIQDGWVLRATTY